MELIAAIEALSFLPPDCQVALSTNSLYLADGLFKWVPAWKRNGWLTKTGEPVKNAELWTRLDDLASARRLTATGERVEDPAVSTTPPKKAKSITRLAPLPLATFIGGVHLDDPIYAYTDGAASGNPGPGGWGAVVQQGELLAELNGGEKMSTNNRMELTAAIEALACLPDGANIVLTTDSQYVKGGITSWVAGWKRNGWQTSNKKEVKNQDLWMRLDELNGTRKVQWEWVKGHNGHPQNERADRLAVAGIPK
jgi:ribonuclease HI